MAKRKGPSLLGIFRQYFATHPDWLHARTTEAVIGQFTHDYPKIEVDSRVKQALFNAKSYAKKGKAAKRGRKQKVAEITNAMKTPHAGNGALQLLENHVDESLAMARAMGNESLREVVGHLHRARNMLVMKIEA